MKPTTAPWFRFARAAIDVESKPPLSEIATGTSALNRMLIASSMRNFSRSIRSSTGSSASSSIIVPTRSCKS